MKKTLIALAAVAAASASYAQVSLSGEFAYGFLTSTDKAGATTSGLGIDTAQFVMKASEDLGGGSSVAVKMVVNTGDFGKGTSSDDQSISLTTSAGVLTLATYKPGDWVTGASGGATWYGLDGKVLSARSTRDAIAFTVPVSPALTLTAALLEPANALGEGAGSSGTTAQSLYNFSAKYSAGPAVVQAAYLSYTNAGSTDATTDNVTRLGASYDLGAAKVGLGLQMGKSSGGTTNTQTALSVSAPLAANVSVNGTWASNQVSSNSALTAGLNGTRTGYVWGLQYNLSKRTYAILNNATWTGTTTDAVTTLSSNNSTTNSFTAVTLVHDF